MTLGQAGVGVVVTTLLVVYAVALIWGTIKKPNGASIMSLFMMLAFMYVGWMLRGWPGRAPHDGLFLTLISAWIDSVQFLLYEAVKLLGLKQAWDKWFRPFWK